MGAALIALSGLVAFADGSGDPKPVKKEGGHYFDAEGNPTYNIGEAGMIDWAAYSGFRRYHSECHVCHGPEGEGSTYAPALKDSLKTMNYNDFVAVVTNGRKNVTSSQTNVMPSFGDNINVMLAAAAMNFKRMMNIWKDYLLALFLRFIQLSKYYYNNQITISILAY